MYTIGIDLGGTSIKAALVHKEKGIIEKKAVPTEADQGPRHVLDRIAGLINEIKENANTEVNGVGLGCPGMISLDRMTVKNPPNFPGWETVNVTNEIRERTGLNSRVENDANLAALGSARFGVGKSYDHFIMLTLGTGVGGGIIFNNQLFRGPTGAAAELGHVIIDYHGPLSNSNTRGGLEAYLGQRFLSRYAADLIRQEPENPLYDQFIDDFEQLEPVDLYHAANDGNELAQKVLRSAGEKLGYAIVNYIHILDIRTIVLSGGVARAGNWILEPARKMAYERLMPPFREGFEILFEELSNDAAMLGAGSLAYEMQD